MYKLMKEKYIDIESEIIVFETADVITSSGTDKGIIDLDNLS